MENNYKKKTKKFYIEISMNLSSELWQKMRIEPKKTCIYMCH